MEFQDPRIKGSDIEQDLSPVSESLRRLAEVVRGEDAETSLHALNDRLSALSEASLFDYEVAGQYRRLAQELREFKNEHVPENAPYAVRDLNDSISGVEQKASRYQNKAAFGKGI